MNLKTKLAAAAILLGSVSMAQATTYSVEGLFTEPMAANDTLFTGTFDWTGGVFSAFTGDMNSSMMVATTAPNLSLMGATVASAPVGNIVTAAVFLNPVTATFDNGTYWQC